MRRIDNPLGLKLVLFLIWPFIAFLHSFMNPKQHSSRVIIYLWFIVFGMSFMPINPLLDSYRYAEKFREQSNYTFTQYMDEVKNVTSGNNLYGERDLYSLTVNYLTGLLTDNIHWLFMVLAIVFGYFYVRSMKFIIPKEGCKHVFFIFPILFVLFCFNNPIFNINGYRMWTAMWIAIYVMFQVLVNQNYKYLILGVLTPLVHSSFVFFYLIFLIYVLTSRYRKVWNILFVISLFFTAASFVSILQDLSSSLPAIFERYILNYATEEAMEQRQAKLAEVPLYAQVLSKMPMITVNVLASICLFNRKEIEKDEISGRVLDFFVVVMSIANFSLSIPSLGVRYVKLAIPFMIYVLLMNPPITKKYKLFIYFIPIAYSYDILYWARYVISVSEIHAYITPLPYIIIRYLT